MNNTKKLNGLVSIGAAAAAVALPAGAAMAQDAVPMLNGYTVTVDGGISRASFMANSFEGKGGGPEGIPHEKGFYGSVSISRAISDVWDWRVSASFLANGDSHIGEADFIDAGMGFDGRTAAVDFGKHLTLGKTNLRVGVGVMAARFVGNSTLFVDIDGQGGADPLGDLTIGETYRGFGPQISAEVEHPVSSDGRTKLIGGLSVGKTFGTSDTSLGGQVAGAPVDKLGSINASALMKSAYLGVSYQKNEQQEWRVGLRTDRLAVDYDQAGGGLLDNNATENSLFVGMKMQF